MEGEKKRKDSNYLGKEMKSLISQTWWLIPATPALAEAEAGGSLQVRGQLALHSVTLSQKAKQPEA